MNGQSGCTLIQVPEPGVEAAWSQAEIGQRGLWWPGLLGRAFQGLESSYGW